jgi:hypothetical protein
MAILENQGGAAGEIVRSRRIFVTMIKSRKTVAS